jgi:hypothetical protein
VEAKPEPIVIKPKKIVARKESTQEFKINRFLNNYLGKNYLNKDLEILGKKSMPSKQLLKLKIKIPGS